MVQFSLSACSVVKRYGGVVALANGNLDVHSGEVVALLGANGSGKSTLSKIITGVVSPDAGTLLLNGQALHLSSPQAARRIGISAVYQELSLIPEMNVDENIWLSHEPSFSGAFVNWRVMRRRTVKLLDLFGGTVRSLKPDVPVKLLPPDERQIVEILKALSTQPRLIILDEATSSLDSRQVARLFELIAEWKANGMAVVFVSHRMDEIFQIADRAVVLRSGKTVKSVSINETNRNELISLMVENAAPKEFVKGISMPSNSAVRLEVRSLSAGRVLNASFSLHDGELVGLGGLQGQGQSDLLLALFGALPVTGEIILSGKPVHFYHPQEAMKAGVAFVPGDRNAEGLLPTRSILENLQLPSWSKYGFPLRMSQARADANRVANNLQLVMPSLDAPVNSLSGGNAQKVVIGKWLALNPRLLLLNDPTKGVDVGAKSEFYKLLVELCAAGTAILFYSSDDDELLSLCNRVLVLHDGVITAELRGEALTRSNLVSASMGNTLKEMMS